LATATSYPLVDEAFMAALLQDIGILALRQLASLEYGALARAGTRHNVLAEGERALFGEDHATLGAWLAERWKLPATLRTAIGFSHTPDNLPADLNPDVVSLVRIVSVAGAVADVWIEQDSAVAMNCLRITSSSLLQLDEETLKEALQRIAKRAAEVASYFDVDLGSPEELAAILEQAKEALMMLAVAAHREANDAREAIGSLEAKARALEQEVQRDGLTGLYSRMFFDRALAQRVDEALREGRSLSLVLFDVDQFKNVNDTYGHQVGDKVLAQIGKALATHLRPADIMARYGGEEFVLLLPNTNEVGAAVVAERLRRVVADTVHSVGDTTSLRVTVSAGHVTLESGSPATGESLLALADSALYAAKRMGRNRVVASQALGQGIAGAPTLA